MENKGVIAHLIKANVGEPEQVQAMFDEIKHKFLGGEVPLPSFWGGYRVSPETIEFWQARESRLHDRFIYRRDDESHWFTQRLAP